MRSKFQPGISIVETVIALLILATIGGALMALNVQIQSAANSAKFRSVAESLAQKMLEQARGDRNELGGISLLKTRTGCYPSGNIATDGKIPGACPPSVANTPIIAEDSGLTFRGYTQVSDLAGGVKVEAVVRWLEKGKDNSTTVSTFLYDY